ncbi:MAG: hypothetical protein KGD64_02765 [Candidatus Heimdallarchaeota archaeon]|nr:hypothetical protein [Candidatus Heimdallarchaeota archaeon]
MVDAIREENKILKKDLISSLINVQVDTKEKFLKSLERQEERVQECLDEIISILLDHIKQEFLVQAVTQFENLQLLLIVNRINDNKHFTRNQITTHFLAILDNLLASIHEKLAQTHFEILKNNMEGLSTGKSFSYNEMKKRQIELIRKGYISKIRKLGYTLKLKDTYCQTVNHMISIYPQHKDKLQTMEIEGYGLVHSKSVPKIDVKKSTAVVIGSQIPNYFSKKEERSLMWNFLEDITDEDEEKLKRKVYRFNTNLRNEENV